MNSERSSETQTCLVTSLAVMGSTLEQLRDRFAKVEREKQALRIKCNKLERKIREKDSEISALKAKVGRFTKSKRSSYSSSAEE